MKPELIWLRTYATPLGVVSGDLLEESIQLNYQLMSGRCVMRFSKLNYCQYLLSSQTNFTLTHLAEHLQQFSHDAINRYLSGEKLTPRLLWEKVKPLICADTAGYLIFDDTVLDKRFSESIDLVRRQYSGNEPERHSRHWFDQLLVCQCQDWGVLGH